MPRFEYVTQKRKGDSYVRSVIDGHSLAEVSIRLNNLNQPIVLIADPSRKKTAETKGRVSLRTKLTFLENLEASVYLGMDFRTALSICLSTTSTQDRSGKRMHHIIERLRDRVSRGMSFANAISSFPEAGPKWMKPRTLGLAANSVPPSAGHRRDRPTYREPRRLPTGHGK